MNDPLLGQQLGSYRLIQMLGRGSFAQVYLGQHIHLDTYAAIKLLHAQLGPWEEQEFRKEAVLLTRLRHQHIVRMMDYGITNARPFLIMELAMKGSLSKIHPHKTWVPLPQVIEYTLQIADGLGYAHEQQIVHRDIKPENILVGDQGNLLLADFGIAKLTSTSHSNSTSTLAGTLAYMAPEQIMGKSTAASDQYALAVMVYEWITGRFPFLGTPPEVIAQHLNNPPPPPRQLNAQISPEVEQVLLIALQKKPEQRFLKIQAFANALKQAAQVQSEQLHTVRSSLLAINPATPPVRGPEPENAQHQQYMYSGRSQHPNPQHVYPGPPPIAGQPPVFPRPQRTSPPVTSLPGLPKASVSEHWWPTFLISTEERRSICQGGVPVEQLGIVGPLSTFPSQPVALPVSNVAIPLSHGSLQNIVAVSAELSPSSSANIADFRLPSSLVAKPPQRQTGTALPTPGKTGVQPQTGTTGAQPRVSNTGAKQRVGGANPVRTSGSGIQTGSHPVSSAGSIQPPRESSGAIVCASMTILAFLTCVILTIITPSTLPVLSNAQAVFGWSWVTLITSFITTFFAIVYSKKPVLRGWMIFFIVAELAWVFVNISIETNFHIY